MSLLRYNETGANGPILIALFTTSANSVPFESWFSSLQDEKTKAIIRIRLNRVRLGNFGDKKPISNGVFELRIDYGPGYRIYCAMDGKTTVIILTAGEKGSQKRDVKTALELWRQYRNEKNARKKT